MAINHHISPHSNKSKRNFSYQPEWARETGWHWMICKRCSPASWGREQSHPAGARAHPPRTRCCLHNVPGRDSLMQTLKTVNYSLWTLLCILTVFAWFLYCEMLCTEIHMHILYVFYTAIHVSEITFLLKMHMATRPLIEYNKAKYL